MERRFFVGGCLKRWRFRPGTRSLVVVEVGFLLMALPSFAAQGIASLSRQLFRISEPVDVKEGRIDPFVEDIAKPGEGD